MGSSFPARVKTCEKTLVAAAVASQIPGPRGAAGSRDAGIGGSFYLVIKPSPSTVQIFPKLI